LGFPTGWSFTTHQALFLAPLPGIEEEEAPTSTTLSHVNYAPAGLHATKGLLHQKAEIEIYREAESMPPQHFAPWQKKAW
jgi:hypothetical protein